jgi:hypothetical protein
MKNIKYLSVLFLLVLFFSDSYSQIVVQRQKLEINNIRSYFQNTGIFDQNTISGNNAGFEWPKGSNKTAVFTAGLTVAAYLNGILSSASCSYKGELAPGYCQNGVPVTNSNFKIYRVSRGDSNSNPDYANWGLMVPYGAPYNDINHNGVFDAGIDIPGVRNADQTIFMCLTDGFISTHDSLEGFLGGKPPLYAEFHITAWAYSTPGLEDVQFVKYEIINKATAPWTRTFMTLFTDPDLGDGVDDYMACDSLRNMGICYNSSNNDPIYGTAPPAVAFKILKGPVINGVPTGLTSFNRVRGAGTQAPCEWNNTLYPRGYYLLMQGYKMDSSCFLDPSFNPPRKTKFILTGEPESGIGWNPSKGWINNCGGDSTGTVVPFSPGDMRMNMNMGANNFTVNPNDTQRIYFAQFIARGTSNLNSMAKLISSANFIQDFFNNGLGYSVSGIVRYNDNNQPVTTGYVKALKLDTYTGNIMILDSVQIQTDGSYQLNNLPIDSVYIGAYPNSSGSTPDFVPTYYNSTIYWQNAVGISITGNLNNLDFTVFRMVSSIQSNFVNGRVFKLANSAIGNLKDAVIYAKNGNTFVKFGFSDANGIFHLQSVSPGNIKFIVDRMGFSHDSITVTVPSSGNIDSVNFTLNQMYVKITKISTEIPEKYSLYQNYPNPFNPVTKIKFEIPSGLSFPNSSIGNPQVLLKVYDILGKEIATLVNEKLNPGTYEVEFNGANLPSGVYFYRLIAGDYAAVKKMLLLK